MRRSILFTSVLVLALAASTATTAAPGRGSLKGTLPGELNFVPTADCPGGLMTVGDAAGTLTHLGRTQMHSEHCTPAGDYNQYGEMSFTAADGDRLDTAYNGYAPLPAPGDDSIRGLGDIEILGGTGRFTDAIGGALDDDWASFAYVVDIDFPGFLPGGDFPPGPWPAVWTIELDEFDY